MALTALPAVIGGLFSTSTTAQQITLESGPKASLSAPGSVDEGNCRAFEGYLVEHTKQPSDSQYSREWRAAVSRFLRSGCSAEDAQGPIHITTVTDRDKRSMVYALTLMGSYDILGRSRVIFCNSPPVPGTCPVRTGQLAPGG